MIESLRTRLEKSCFAPSLKGRNKRAVLEELADLLVDGGAIATDRRGDVLAALLDREQKMSTGMQLGVAIPHAKTNRVEQLVTAVALSKDGVEFDSLDGQLSYIFVATVSPPADAGAHIRFLADISRQLASRRVRERVGAARTSAEMVAALCDDGNEA